MGKEIEDKIADKIIKGIWSDIYGRSGGDYFLDCGGDIHRRETQKEMKENWRKVIKKALKVSK